MGLHLSSDMRVPCRRGGVRVTVAASCGEVLTSFIAMAMALFAGIVVCWLALALFAISHVATSLSRSLSGLLCILLTSCCVTESDACLSVLGDATTLLSSMHHHWFVCGSLFGHYFCHCCVTSGKLMLASKNCALPKLSHALPCTAVISSSTAVQLHVWLTVCFLRVSVSPPASPLGGSSTCCSQERRGLVMPISVSLPGLRWANG